MEISTDKSKFMISICVSSKAEIQMNRVRLKMQSVRYLGAIIFKDGIYENVHLRCTEITIQQRQSHSIKFGKAKVSASPPLLFCEVMWFIGSGLFPYVKHA